MTLSTLQDLMDAAARATGSDYKTAQALNITQQRASDWRHGRVKAQAADWALLAGLAGLDPTKALIAATIHKHRGTPKGEHLLELFGEHAMKPETWR